MKRKASRAVRAADKLPRRRNFSKVNLNRVLSVVRRPGTPVSRIDIDAETGNLSLTIGGTGKPGGDDPINEQQLKDLI